MSDSLAVIEGGTLAGIRPGARVAFYALNGVPGELPFSLGVVSNANEVSADVLLSVPDANRQIKESRALLSEYSYGSLEMRVAVGIAPDSARRALLDEVVREIGSLRLVEAQPDLVVTTLEGSNTLVFVKTAADDVTLAGPFDLLQMSDRENLATVLRAFARNRFLAQVEMRDPNIDVRLEIVPATHQISRQGCESSDTTRHGALRTAGGWVFHKDDGYLLRLRNVGRDPAYVAVLEISRTGLTQLFPNASLRVTDNRLEPGRSFLVRDLCFAAEEPFGDYILKLFATRERFDFAPIVATRGATRGDKQLTYVEQLLADAYGGTRSGVSARAAGTGSTFALTTKVVPR